jgi:2-polyprenyl-3-methyl-5-hydroxy-6-metoxy-1,4-benzoquinol methylase
MITLEVARMFPRAQIQGIDLSPTAIQTAERTRLAFAVENAQFSVGDVSAIQFGSVDAALVLDVIEHLEDPSILVGSLGRAVRTGGRLVISTPTRPFPRVFGREFHQAVGHVRDGYRVEEIARLLAPAGFHVDASVHYTKLPAAIGCALFYRFIWKYKIALVLSPVLNALSLLDRVWPSTRGACSLLVTATRR